MESKSTVIYDFLEKQIVKGDLKPGDKLPSESELCNKYSVSRGPVRAALEKLSAIGLVFRKKGGGTYVAEQSMDKLLNTILPTLKFHTGNLQEIQDIRCALEKLSLELCLKKHEDNDYDQLDRAIKAMVKEDHNKETFFYLDRDFHTAISHLTGNFLLHTINLLLWDLLHNVPKNELYILSLEEIVIQHKRIYKSIKENDLELATLYTVRHLARAIRIESREADPIPDKKRWNPWLSNTL
jgi:GntR family transcriptional repressor for pyruvate dehydrogenase complex